ncbi:hypothetical protein J4460_05125, partial [Candidatus Woesearchaeota archaeon]|nr:hypothetical protein [Candidatus Woesearchaeota archaeon]
VFSEDSTYRSPHISIAKKYHYIKVLKLKRYAIRSTLLKDGNRESNSDLKLSAALQSTKLLFLLPQASMLTVTPLPSLVKRIS